jgi:alpha-1,3-rhamnosyltransferase
MDTSNGAEPICSVCCLSYNHSKFIEKNLESIWGQTYRNIEIIALDDGSPDNSGEILEQMKLKSPFPMQVIRQTNSGNVPLNLNTMYLRARGKYIVFIACDDFLHSSAIKKKIEIMEKDSNITLVASQRCDIVDDKNDIIRVQKVPLKRLKSAKELYEFEYINVHTFYIQNAVFRKSIIDAVNGFDTDLISDDFAIRTKIWIHMIKNQSLKFKIINDKGLCYRHHQNNVSKNSARQIISVAQVFTRYYPNKPLPNVYRKWFSTLDYDGILKVLTNKDFLDLISEKNRGVPWTNYRFDIFSLYAQTGYKEKSVAINFLGKEFKIFREKK